MSKQQGFEVKGEYLTKRREELNLSLAEVAAFCDGSTTLISKLEIANTGKSKAENYLATLKSLTGLAIALGTSIDKFLTYVEIDRDKIIQEIKIKLIFKL